ncbi:COP9 signalosome complex subunit 8 [Diplonema papillatum]|nr:COP9 signalosome complex subunit 8 [Diplonema papillatum]
MPSLDERVDAHVSKGLWTKVAREIEMYDCEQPGTPATAVVYAKGLLSYLICGELNGARFLFRRLPEAEQNDPSVTAVWEIGKALWRHDTKGAHEEIARHTWSNELHPIVDALQRMCCLYKGFIRNG